MFTTLTRSLLSGILVFAVMPTSSNYTLNNYSTGSGGVGNAGSTNYQLNATTGEVSNQESTSTNFKTRSGNNNLQQAHVPTSPTFDNPANYYNKLHFAVAPGANASDTKFAIAISSDNFASTQYIQNDNTVGAVLGIEDYQTYAAWGSASGQLVTGLIYNTAYKIKVKSFKGSFTETEFGPTAAASTVPLSITFDIDVSAADTETAPPYATSFGSLLPAAVTNTPEKIWIDLATNAESGAIVYVTSANGGLKSTGNGFTITSASADLTAASTGFGAQGSSVAQTSGGPLSIVAPYNVAAQNVGILNSTIRAIFSSSTPITAGRGSFQLKAKAAALTPAATDYQDTLTITTAASF